MSYSQRYLHMSNRLDNLDALRFVAATWVALSHGALPLKQLFSDPIARFIGTVIGSSFNGSSAVMVFFIISGLCIHRPYVDAASLSITTFLIRRYIRIGLPLIAILAVAHSIGAVAVGSLQAVLWSVYVELIYYSIYPLLFYAARQYGWAALIIAASTFSAYLTFAHLDYTNMQQFSELTWLWGLPIWLAGCKLAEDLGDGKSTRAPGSLFTWRLTAWGLGAIALFLNNNSPIRIGQPVTMLFFSTFAYFWLSKELTSPGSWWRWLEGLGAASYSLYLIHHIIIREFDAFVPFARQPFGILLQWATIATATYVFYKLIEAPSHRFARRAAQVVSLRLSPLLSE